MGWALVNRHEHRSTSAIGRLYAAIDLPGTFPHTNRYTTGLTAGTGHDRFDFTIGLMIDGLAHR